MKTCINCGAQIEEGNKFCPHCGTKIEAEVQEQAYQPYQPSDTSSSSASAEAYPMKWHKFLMVVMVIGSVLIVFSGIALLTGMQYNRAGVEAEDIYRTFPGLKSCDMCYGIILIALGVFQFIVRNRLKQFKENGPSSLKILYILSIAASLGYMLWANAATGVNMFTSSNVSSLIASGTLLFINNSYYSKRMDLFVN